ncbi:MAG TPA: hypothetical protein VIM84_12370 [Gemmatimonadales bacterium]
MRRILMAVGLITAPIVGRAQATDLTQAAERARQACMAHDAAALVAQSPRVQVQLPGAEPSAALGPDQAAALLNDFFASGQEVETQVQAAREVGPGRGYVELQRKYRIAGTQDVRVQVLLLSYRKQQGRWNLVEVRVVG